MPGIRGSRCELRSQAMRYILATDEFALPGENTIGAEIE
jgi:hypothetical protein